jgi:hypothetical protein
VPERVAKVNQSETGRTGAECERGTEL